MKEPLFTLLGVLVIAIAGVICFVTLSRIMGQGGIGERCMRDGTCLKELTCQETGTGQDGPVYQCFPPRKAP